MEIGMGIYKFAYCRNMRFHYSSNVWIAEKNAPYRKSVLPGNKLLPSKRWSSQWINGIKYWRLLLFQHWQTSTFRWRSRSKRVTFLRNLDAKIWFFWWLPFFLECNGSLANIDIPTASFNKHFFVNVRLRVKSTSRLQGRRWQRRVSPVVKEERSHKCVLGSKKNMENIGPC